MARLLTEEEHEALLADRARLEWVLDHHATWDVVDEVHGVLEWEYDAIAAPNARHAIDVARGVL